MLIEYLFLKGKDELCSSEKEFVHFLSANGRLSVDKKTIKFESTDIKYTLSKEDVNGKTKETVFHLTIEASEEKKLALEELDSVLRRMNDECGHLFIINTIWNDVATDYLKQLYPQIVEIEHLLRKIIYRLMIKAVGSAWIEKGIPKEVKDKIEEIAKRSQIEQFVEDQLEYADFIQLGNFLFTSYSMNSDLQHMTGELTKAKGEKDPGHRIDKIISQYESKSNWERYFSEKIHIEELKEKWERMYSYRNAVAHAKRMSGQAYASAVELIKELKTAFNDCLKNVDAVELNREQTEAIQEVAKETMGKKENYSELRVPISGVFLNSDTNGIRLDPYVVSSGVSYDIMSDGTVRTKPEILQSRIIPMVTAADLTGNLRVTLPETVLPQAQVTGIMTEAGKSVKLDATTFSPHAQVSVLADAAGSVKVDSSKVFLASSLKEKK